MFTQKNPTLFALSALALSCFACGGEFDPDSPGKTERAPQALDGSGVAHVMLPPGASSRSEANGIRTGSITDDLYYHGGMGGIGVETTPKVYLVLWGSQWSSDPSGEAAILTNFFRGVG